MIRTSFIVLRRTPFKESGLVIAGLSPDCGRVDLIVKGARTIGRKKFPVYELFRELAIQFNEPKNEGLVSPRSVEPLAEFDAIAKNPEGYLAACEHAAFVLRHSRQMLPCPESYEALKAMLSRLASNSCDAKKAVALAKLAFLEESGLVPEGVDPELLESAAGRIPPPQFDDAYWKRMTDWIDGLASWHGLK